LSAHALKKACAKEERKKLINLGLRRWKQGSVKSLHDGISSAAGEVEGRERHRHKKSSRQSNLGLRLAHLALKNDCLRNSAKEGKETVMHSSEEMGLDLMTESGGNRKGEVDHGKEFDTRSHEGGNHRYEKRGKGHRKGGCNCIIKRGELPERDMRFRRKRRVRGRKGFGFGIFGLVFATERNSHAKEGLQDGRLKGSSKLENSLNRNVTHWEREEN